MSQQRSEMRPVCIGGMHRSGTSMVARLLHLCGLYLGKEGDLLDPTPANPEGFWEYAKFVDLNDEILNELGGAYDCPPPMPSGWEQQQGFLPLREKAAFILREFFDHKEWGWKDPRNSLTLPFWKDFFPEMRVIICVRNPLEVALSLKRRNTFSYELGLTLWKVYNQHVLESTLPEYRIVTHYEAYFHNPHKELRRVLDFLGMSVSEETTEQCLSAVSPKLRHNRFTMQDLLDADVSPVVVKLYMRMCEEAGWLADGAAHHDPKANGSPSASGQWLREWSDKREALPTEGYEGAVAEGKKGMPELDMQAPGVGRLNKVVVQAVLLCQEKATNRDLRERLAERYATIQDLRERLAQRNAKNQNLRERLAGLEDENRDLRERLAELEEHIGYRQLIRRIREVVRAALPSDATVIVASKGDNELLQLDVRQGWHFPQTEDGSYAGHHPADSAAAIEHLEELRGEGGSYLLFPSTALWWLDHYDEFREHLESRYQVLVREEGVCVVFALEAAERGASSHSIELRSHVRQILEVAQSVLPEDAVVIVANRYDEELLKLDGLRAWGFPLIQASGSTCSDLAERTSLIDQIETLRADGADFLVVPSEAYSWLEQQREFRQHLEQHYPTVIHQKHVCWIIALRGTTPGWSQASDDRQDVSGQQAYRLRENTNTRLSLSTTDISGADKRLGV